MISKSTVFMGIFATLLMVVSAAGGDGTAMAEDWSEGFEEEYLDHSFSEQMWTNSGLNFTGDDGGQGSFTASYVNADNVQAFLVAFNGAAKDNKSGVVPYQMFGMHYYTPGGNEVFLGALLASLIVYNDTNANGYPDPDDGDNRLLYVFPFGVGADINPGHQPRVTPIPAKKLGEGHYSFGMKYENLYAYVSPNPLLSALLRTGWIAEFSELTITYEMTMDKDAGTFTAETFYTIGQVTDLWTFVLGVPIHSPDTRLDASLGLGALHYVSIFTSRYTATDGQGNVLSDDIDDKVNGTVDVGVGEEDERAFSIGFRGEYDLLDEENSNAEISKDGDALNVLLEARPAALLLVGWQLAFSARIFSIVAYGLSDLVRDRYDSPWDLANRSLNPFNPEGFGVQVLWYAVLFPSWQGYRVVHDPVYTAYTSFGKGAAAKEEDGATPGLTLPPALLAVAAVTVVVAAAAGRRRG